MEVARTASDVVPGRNGSVVCARTTRTLPLPPQSSVPSATATAPADRVVSWRTSTATLDTPRIAPPLEMIMVLSAAAVGGAKALPATILLRSVSAVASTPVSSEDCSVK